MVSVELLPMASQYPLDKVNHVLNLMSSLQKLKENADFCDFKIQVGEECFPVHRNVLAACSGYFRAMFSHEMTEVKKGMVGMQSLKPDSVKRCIDFMYTGEVNLSMVDAPDLLHASDFMQINDLTEVCIKFLITNLAPNNCICAKELAQMYSKDGLKDVAERYIIDHFVRALRTPDFLEITEQDLSYYIKVANPSYINSWKAVSTWIKHDVEARKESLHPLMLSLELESFPFKYLLQVVYKDPLLRNSEKCEELLAMCLFSCPETLQEQITVANVLTLKLLAQKYSSSAIIKMLNTFIQRNFETIVENPGVMELTKSDILFLIKSKETKCSSEVIKWNAALKWVKHDQSRTGCFYELLKLIKFDKISSDFIQNVVRTEELVNDEPKCKDFIDTLPIEGLSPDKDQPKPTESRALQDQTTASPNSGWKYLTNLKDVLFGQNSKQTPCMAVFSGDWEEVRSFRPHENKWEYIANVEESNLIGIVNVDGKLFLASRRSLYQLQDSRSWRKITDIKGDDDTTEAAVVSFQRCIYVMHRNFMLCYDPTEERWSEDLPGHGLDSFSSAASNEFIYIVGELITKRYDPKTKFWSDIIPPPYGRSSAAVAVMGGKVYVIGGSESPCSVAFYNPDVDLWTEVSWVNIWRIHGSACVVGGKLHVVGGAFGLLLEENSVEEYDEHSDEWRIVGRFNLSEGPVFACPYKN